MDIFSPQIFPAVTALTAVFLTSVSTWIITLINRRFDERRHVRQTAIDAAIAQWTVIAESTARCGEVMQTPVSIPPLDPYLVHMLGVSRLLSDKRITPENIEAELRKIRLLSSAAGRAATDNPKQHRPN